MRHLVRLLSRFRKDERGAFGVLFAVMAIALIAFSGAAVDFTVLEQARTRAQVALDAAALALQSHIYDTNAAKTIQTQAQTLLTGQLADAATTWKSCQADNSGTAPCAYVTTPTIDTTNGQLTLTANLKVPMYFVSLVGVTQIPAQIVSVATRKKLALEVAMVLDNSGSMYYTMGYNSHINDTDPTRMDTLQSSATCAANILFYGVTSCSASTSGLTANPNVKIGLVPFTQAVNVGPSNYNASWLDRTGAASITRNNFDNDDDTSTTFTGSVDRIALITGMKDKNGNALSWGGCVEARANPYDTDDTPPTTGDTLYTPYFAVDEPGSANSAGGHTYGGETYYNTYISDSPSACNQTIGCTWTEVKTKCNSWSDCKSAYYGGTDTNTYTKGSTTYAHPPSSCSCSGETILTDSGTNTYTGSGSYGRTYTRVRTCNDTYTPTGLTNREYQERLCKYTGAQLAYSTSAGNVFGPNGDCPAASVLPLTSTPSTVISAINAMSPQGGTNITEGSVWGWHVLSPDSPFSSKGAAYSSTTSKVLIIMTDGENTIYPGTNMNYDTFYSAYAYPWNNRLGVVTSSDTTLEGIMNSRLSTVCTNAKAAGITVYTIGVDVADTSDPTGNQTLLTNCASETSYAYFPNTASDLQNAFVSIANQLAALRLAK